MLWNGTQPSPLSTKPENTYKGQSLTSHKGKPIGLENELQKQRLCIPKNKSIPTFKRIQDVPPAYTTLNWEKSFFNEQFQISYLIEHKCPKILKDLRQVRIKILYPTMSVPFYALPTKFGMSHSIFSPYIVTKV